MALHRAEPFIELQLHQLKFVLIVVVYRAKKIMMIIWNTVRQLYACSFDGVLRFDSLGVEGDGDPAVGIHRRRDLIEKFW
jgi:hypothetical protein